MLIPHECTGLNGEKLKQCEDFYIPLYDRNQYSVMQCRLGEGKSFYVACEKLLSALCEGQSVPSGLPPARSVPTVFYSKYIEPTCNESK